MHIQHTHHIMIKRICILQPTWNIRSDVHANGLAKKGPAPRKAAECAPGGTHNAYILTTHTYIYTRIHVQHTHACTTHKCYTHTSQHTHLHTTHTYNTHTHIQHTHTHTHTHNNEPQDDITCSGSPGSRHSAAHKTACLSFKASHSIFFVISVALPPAPATRGLCANAASSTGDCPRRRHVCSNTASSGPGASFSHLSSAMRLRACSVCGKRQE